MAYEIPSLKLTASLHLKMDDWKIQFPVGMAYLDVPGS